MGWVGAYRLAMWRASGISHIERLILIIGYACLNIFL